MAAQGLFASHDEIHQRTGFARGRDHPGDQAFFVDVAADRITPLVQSFGQIKQRV